MISDQASFPPTRCVLPFNCMNTTISHLLSQVNLANCVFFYMQLRQSTRGRSHMDIYMPNRANGISWETPMTIQAGTMYDICYI